MCAGRQARKNPLGGASGLVRGCREYAVLGAAGSVLVRVGELAECGARVIAALHSVPVMVGIGTRGGGGNEHEAGNDADGRRNPEGEGERERARRVRLAAALVGAAQGALLGAGLGLRGDGGECVAHGAMSRKKGDALGVPRRWKG